MKCPFGERRKPGDCSRISKDGSATETARVSACEKRFTTYEFVEEVLPWWLKRMVAEAFDRQKNPYGY